MVKELLFKTNTKTIVKRKETEENKATRNMTLDFKFMKEINKLTEFSEMRCSF